VHSQTGSSVAVGMSGVRASVASGGILCVVGTAVLTLILPPFWRYERP
jgi:hypothetical protein